MDTIGEQVNRLTEQCERPGKRPFLTLGQAAKEVGKSKATISKAITDGRLSVYERSSDGFKIDTAELFRVFAPNRSLNTHTERSERPDERSERPDERGERLQVNTQNTDIEVLKVKLEAAEQLLRDRDQAINDLRQRLDKESDERRKLTDKIASLLLPAPKDAQSKEEADKQIVDQATELNQARARLQELEAELSQVTKRRSWWKRFFGGIDAGS